MPKGESQFPTCDIVFSVADTNLTTVDSTPPGVAESKSYLPWGQPTGEEMRGQGEFFLWGLKPGSSDLACGINSKLEAVSVDTDFADFFILGFEGLVIEPTFKIPERKLPSFVGIPKATYHKNGTSKTVIQNDAGAIPRSVVTVRDSEDFRGHLNFRQQFRFRRVVGEPDANSSHADHDNSNDARHENRAQTFPRLPLRDQRRLRILCWLLGLRRSREFWT